MVENPAYAPFSRRVIAAAGRRVAAGDAEALPELLALATAVEEAIGQAVPGLRDVGYSWTEIAAPLGVTRQAAHQRWAADPAATSDPTEVAR
jgi:hypothetical protein